MTKSKDSKIKKDIDKNVENVEHVTLVPQNEKLDKLKDEMRKRAKELRESGAKYEPLVITENHEIKRACDLTIIEQEEELIKCILNPIYFIETYLTIFDQTANDGKGDIVPFKLFSDQKRLIENFVKNRFNIANKYRQAGISTATCAYISWYICFNRNRSVAVVADKLDTAKNELMNDVVEFIASCPEFLRVNTGKLAKNNKILKNTQQLKVYDNDSKIGAFSSKGLRGYTPTLLFWDETAWTEKGDKFWTSAFPTLQTGGNAILVSTPNGLDPVFYKTFETARKNINTNEKDRFNAIELWWFNDPRYNAGLTWYKNKGKPNEIIQVDNNFTFEHRINLMDNGWQATSPWFENQVVNANYDMKRISQEILCSFLGSGDNFIAEEFIRRIEEHEKREPLRKEYSDSNMWIFEDPIQDENYTIIVDVSSGHGDDNSTINILKETITFEEKYIQKNGKSKKIKLKKVKSEQVAEYYGKLTPQQLADVVYLYGIKYNYGRVVIDVTGGYGSQTVERLMELGYENIFYSEIIHKATRDRLNGYVKLGNKKNSDGTVVHVDLLPGFFIGNNRGSLLLEFQRSISMEDLIIRSDRTIMELKTFVNVNGSRVADHKRSFHDDSIIGLAIGVYCLNYLVDNNGMNPETTKILLDSIMTANSENLLKYQKEQKFNESNKAPIKSGAFINKNKPQNGAALEYQKYSWLFKSK